MECEEAIKKDSVREDSADPGSAAMGAKSLCIPLEQVINLLTACISATFFPCFLEIIMAGSEPSTCKVQFGLFPRKRMEKCDFFFQTERKPDGWKRS